MLIFVIKINLNIQDFLTKISFMVLPSKKQWGEMLVRRGISNSTQEIASKFENKPQSLNEIFGLWPCKKALKLSIKE